MEALRHHQIGLLLVALCFTGCHHLAQFCPFLADPEGPPPGPVCKVVAMWNPQVAYSPDPVNGGTPGPGLAGRIYLFDQNIGHPQAGDGALIAELYDARPATNQGKPVLLEQWRFDPETVKRLLRKDTIGQGYTLFLPWGTYQPSINKILVKVCYQPAHGPPVYGDTAPITLQSERKGRDPATAALPMPKPVAP